MQLQDPAFLKAIEIIASLMGFVFVGSCAVIWILVNIFRKGAKEGLERFEARADAALEKLGNKLENVTVSVNGIGAQMAVVVERTLRHEKMLEPKSRRKS